MSAAVADPLDSRPVRVLHAAAGAGRLGQSLLLHGADAALLERVAHGIAETLLQRPGYAPPAGRHPDCFALRPAGKMRLIKVGDNASEPNTMRAFLHQVALAPSVGDRKVGIVHEADRLNAASANAFLKTLEEPPGGTTLLLLTTRPHALLPTIRSRCIHFFLPGALEGGLEPEMAAWVGDFRAWLDHLGAGIAGKAAACEPVMGLYGLVARQARLLELLADRRWKAQPRAEGLDEDEEAALLQGVSLGYRQQLWQEVARAVRAFAHVRLTGDQAAETRRRYAATLDSIEEAARLMRYNLGDGPALEFCLLQVLRIWSRKAD